MFWKKRFTRTPGIEVRIADALEDGWRDWIAVGQLILAAGEERPK
jgi:hypothetical protein